MQITVDVDIQAIADKCVHQGALIDTVAWEIRRSIIDQCVKQIKESTDLSSVLEDNYGKTYLKNEAIKVIDQALSDKVKERVQEYAKRDLDSAVARSIRDAFDAVIVPRVQGLIGRLVVFNEDAIDEEREAMERAIEDSQRDS